MTTKEYPEILLVRFTRAQRKWISKESRRMKTSEAAIVRRAVDYEERILKEAVKNWSKVSSKIQSV